MNYTHTQKVLLAILILLSFPYSIASTLEQTMGQLTYVAYCCAVAGIFWLSHYYPKVQRSLLRSLWFIMLIGGIFLFIALYSGPDHGGLATVALVGAILIASCTLFFIQRIQSAVSQKNHKIFFILIVILLVPLSLFQYSEYRTQQANNLVMNNINLASSMDFNAATGVCFRLVSSSYPNTQDCLNRIILSIARRERNPSLCEAYHANYCNKTFNSSLLSKKSKKDICTYLHRRYEEGRSIDNKVAYTRCYSGAGARLSPTSRIIACKSGYDIHTRDSCKMGGGMVSVSTELCNSIEDHLKRSRCFAILNK